MVPAETLVISECDLASGLLGSIGRVALFISFNWQLSLLCSIPFVLQTDSPRTSAIATAHSDDFFALSIVYCRALPRLRCDAIPSLNLFRPHVSPCSFSRRHLRYCLQVAGSSVRCFYICVCLSEFNFSTRLASFEPNHVHIQSRARPPLAT